MEKVRGKSHQRYFVSKIVLTYGEKKIFKNMQEKLEKSSAITKIITLQWFQVKMLHIRTITLFSAKIIQGDKADMYLLILY